MKLSILTTLFLSLLLAQTDFRTIVEQADEYFENSEFNESYSLYVKAHDIKPYDFILNDLLGLNCLYINKDNEAIGYLKNAIEHSDFDDSLVDTYYNLACAYSKLNLLTESLNALTKSVELGYMDYEWILEGSDFNNLRKTSQFKKFYKNYFSDKDISVINLMQEASTLYHNENYSKAIKIFKKAIKKEKQSTKVLNSWTSIGNSYIALSYNKLGLPAKAIKYRLKTIDVIDEKHNISLFGLISYDYSKLSDYDKAIEYRSKAVRLAKLYADSTEIAEQLSGLSTTYSLYLKDEETQLNILLESMKYYPGSTDKSDYANDAQTIGLRYSELCDFRLAKQYTDLSIQLYKEIKDDLGLIESYMLLVLIQIFDGEIDKAEDTIKTILSFNEIDQDIEQKILFHFTIGVHFASIGRQNKAINNFKIAIDLMEENNLQDLTGMENFIGYNVIVGWASQNNKDRNNYLKRAVELADKLKINTIMSNYGKAMYYGYAENKIDTKIAIKFLLRAVRLYEKNPNADVFGKGWITHIYDELAGFYWISGNIEKTYYSILKSFQISAESNNQLASIAKIRSLTCLLGLASLDNTVDTEILREILKEMYMIVETEIQVLSERHLKDLIEPYMYIYDLFATYTISTDSYNKTIEILESSRNKQLINYITKDYSNKYVDYSDIEIDSDQTVVYISLLNKSIHPMYNFVSESSYPKVYSILDTMKVKYQDNLFLSVISNNPNSEEGGYTYNYDIILWDSTQYFDNHNNIYDIINLYQQKLKLGFSDSKEYSQYLYNLMIKPIKPFLDGYSKLTLIVDPYLNNVPFESLIDENGKYLIESFDINYVPSFSVMKLLQSRNYDQKNKTGLLALGGANYNTNTSEVLVTDIASIRGGIYDSIENANSMSDYYEQLGYINWSDLPGSLYEVQEISKVMTNSTAIVGEKVTEEYLKNLSRDDLLRDFSIIHFATHAFIESEIPELSAIVLSQVENTISQEDGYLHLAEIADLDINADLVTLSACETGLGKKYIGEGIVGLSYAFLIAGANAVIQSLWPVEDNATSDFMISFYMKIANGTNQSVALSQTKREFIKGRFGDEYRNPFYWAPFIYVGTD